MYASKYFEGLMLNLLKGQTISIPGPLYLGLFLSNPGDTGTGGTEISYNRYARQVITFSNPTPSGNGLMTQNSQMISYEEADSSVGTATVTHVAVFDDLTSGNMLLYGWLDTALVVQAGVSPVFRAGSVKWIWSGNFSAYYRDKIMRTLIGTTLSGIGTPYIGLFNGNPETTGAELTGDNYARIAVTFSNPSYVTTDGPTSVNNTADVMSNISTSNWSSLTHVAICDASSGGNAFAIIPLGRTYTITLGTAVGFHAGDLQVNVN